MDLNGWLTVITVFTAIFALLPKEDLILYRYKTSRLERVLIFSILVFVIPYLIVFPQLINKWPDLKIFTVSWGIKSTNLAFILFFISFLWILYRLFISKTTIKSNEKAINYFQEILSEKPFEEFYSIFIKHTSPKEINNNWVLYRSIIMHPKFLSGVFPNNTNYLLEFWENFENEEDFKSIFRLFLENKDSEYYKEIKLHAGTYSLRPDAPFLNKIIKERLEQSIENGMIDILSDYIQTLLHNESHADSIYNHKHYYARVRDDEGFDLPLYYHIRFYGLIHNYAIRNKTGKWPRMISFYSSMTDVMVKNIRLNKEFERSEYPTNYHWLIGEICMLINDWSDKFGEECYIETGDHNWYIPKAFDSVILSLYRAFPLKISQEFICRMMYYYMLSTYFDTQINPKFKKHIEEEVIANIPLTHIEPILDFALNEKFAIHYRDFQNGRFGRVAHEIKILNQLHKFLKSNNTMVLDN